MKKNQRLLPLLLALTLALGMTPAAALATDDTDPNAPNDVPSENTALESDQGQERGNHEYIPPEATSPDEPADSNESDTSTDDSTGSFFPSDTAPETEPDAGESGDSSDEGAADTETEGLPVTVSWPKDKVYDGKPVNDPFVVGKDPSVEAIWFDWFHDGVQLSGAPTDSGVYTCTLNFTVAGGLDVRTAEKSVEISKRPITVTAKDQTVNKGEDYVVSIDMLEVAGDFASGEAITDFEILNEQYRLYPAVHGICDEASNDVTSNYDITYVPGNLTILDAGESQAEEAGKVPDPEKKPPLLKKEIVLVETGDALNVGLIATILLLGVGGAVLAWRKRK